MTAPAPDRRLTPATDRVALESWRDVLDRPAYVPGRPVRLATALADLCRSPAGPRDRQVNFGADLVLIDEQGPWAFVQAVADGYCGWLPASHLARDAARITHRVSAPATHVYPQADMKTPELMLLSLGARLAVVGVQNGFARLAQGGWVPLLHLDDQPATDPATVAESLIGTPYLWGGNSRSGIDCSGLAQAGLAACAIACPGDSDMQQAAFPVAEGAIRRNDLLFWPGHVAVALDATRMIHATAWKMRVVIEPIAAAMTRIEAAGHGPFRGARRPPAGRNAAFP